MASRRIKNYEGLFGEQFEPFNGFFLHYESLRKRTLAYNYEITEHLHPNLVQLFLITSGSGLLLSLGKKIRLESPGVLIIPCNVLHGFVFQSEIRGSVLTVSNSQFEQFLTNTPALFSKFDQLRNISFNKESLYYQELLDLKNRIIRELQQPDKATSFQLSLLFQSFLVNLYRSMEENETFDLETTDRTLNHFHTFKKLIRQSGHEDRSIQFYARQMNLTTVHLNRICKIVVQKTALQVVHDNLLQEAKKFLKGTNYSISEIAYFLDFKDPAHFSKFFKKKEGITPSRFRSGN